MKTNWLILSLALLSLFNWQKAYSQVDSNKPEDYAGLSPKEHIIANLLLTHKTEKKAKIAAKVLFYNEGKISTELLDIAALRANELFPDHEDTTAWLFKAIGKSSRHRYLSFFEEKKAQTDNSKLLSHINKAIKKAKKSQPEDNFIVSNHNIDDIHQKIIQSNAQTLFSSKHINLVENGDNVDQVYEKLGRPSLVSSWTGEKTIFIGHPHLKEASFDTSSFKIIYEGSGSISFNSVDGDYIVAKMANLNKTDNLRRKLIPADPKKSQSIARELTLEPVDETGFYDVAAEKIWLERNTDNRYMMDAISHLIRYIGNSHDPRYTTFTQRIADEASNKKFRRHAKRALKTLPEDIEGIEQYTPPGTQSASE